MADTKISALSAVTTPAGASEFAVNEAGTSKKLTLAQVNAFCEPLCNASTSSVSAAFATDTYLAGSSIAVPTTRLQAKSIYRCRFNVTKTAAGTATPILSLRYGTNGSTADTARCTLTHAVQTAASDEGVFEILATFRTVGSGTSAVIAAISSLTHRQSITGLSTDVSGMKSSISSGFDSTPAGSIIGLSVNGGSSAAWTVALVQAELINLL